MPTPTIADLLTALRSARLSWSQQRVLTVVLGETERSQDGLLTAPFRADAYALATGHSMRWVHDVTGQLVAARILDYTPQDRDTGHLTWMAPDGWPTRERGR